MAFDLGNLLQQYLGGNNNNSASGGPAPSQQSTDAHFDQAAQAAPPDLLTRGLSAMFHSDATPPFGQMAGQLFNQSNPTQQAGLLNQLIAGMGPAVLGSLMNSGGGGGGLGGGSGIGAILGRLTGGNPQATITPDQAATVTPEQVQVLAEHAHQSNPGIVDTVSGFYAQHPGLVKTLGSAALTIALAKMAEHQRAG